MFIKSQLGWKDSYYFCKENVSRNKTDLKIDDDTKKAILKRNWLDVELYEWSVKYFEKQIDDIPDFGKKVALYKIINNLNLIFYCKPIFLVRKSIRLVKKKLFSS